MSDVNPNDYIEVTEKSSFVEKQMIEQDEIKKIYKEIESVLKSKNPLDFYFKIKNIKEQIANIIKSIVDEVITFFDINNKSKIYELYYRTGYGDNIKNHIRPYLEQSKYFDLRFYFAAVCLFDKEKQYVIKGLIKMYKGDSNENIKSFLEKFAKKTTLKEIKRIYEQFQLSKLDIKKKYLDENKPNIFMDKLILALEEPEDRTDIMKHFKININKYSFVKGKKNIKEPKVFQELIKIFGFIVRNYIRPDRLDGQKDMEYINQNTEIKTLLDQEIAMYMKNKNNFYTIINKIFEGKNVDKTICWRYIRTQMINIYFSETKFLFYWNCVNKFQDNREKWNSLAVDLQESEDSYIKKLTEFKNMIISIQSNVFWTFWKPIVYNLILDTLKVDKKGFNKMFFIMCFIVANNHGEYRQLYKFFNEIRIIYGFGGSSTFANIAGKFKLSMSIVIGLVLILGWLYFAAPFMLFVSIALLIIIYYAEYLTNDSIKSKVDWNFGLKAYLTISAIVFGFTFVINLGKHIDEGGSYTQKINQISQVTTSDVVAHSLSGDVVDYMADILKGEKK